MEPAQSIKQFIVDEFVPDVGPEDLPADGDLLAEGVLDSLGLVRVIRWLETRYELSILDADQFEWEDFQSVAAMSSFVEHALRHRVASS